MSPAGPVTKLQNIWVSENVVNDKTQQNVIKVGWQSIYIFSKMYLLYTTSDIPMLIDVYFSLSRKKKIVDNMSIAFARLTSIPPDMKGCVCHIVKWQIHPFISKVTIYFRMLHSNKLVFEIMGRCRETKLDLDTKYNIVMQYFIGWLTGVLFFLHLFNFTFCGTKKRYN